MLQRRHFISFNILIGALSDKLAKFSTLLTLIEISQGGASSPLLWTQVAKQNHILLLPSNLKKKLARRTWLSISIRRLSRCATSFCTMTLIAADRSLLRGT